MNPISHQLNKLDWDFFITLTFKKIPSRLIQKKCIFHFLRCLGQKFGASKWKWQLMYAVRHEFGEKTGRPHFHLVLKFKTLNIQNYTTIANQIKSIWQTDVAGSAGFADVRIFDPSKTGVDYIMKADQGWFTSRANNYEIQKFYFENLENLDLPLLVAPSVLWELQKRKRSGNGTDRRYNSEGLARFLRALRKGKTHKSEVTSNKKKSFNPTASHQMAIHPHTPKHILKSRVS